MMPAAVVGCDCVRYAFVGRDQEVALLHGRWEQAVSGEGQAVLLCGEGSTGKSRIAEHLRVRLDEGDHIRLRNQCSPFISTARYSRHRPARIRDKDLHARISEPGTVRGSTRPAHGQTCSLKLSTLRGALQLAGTFSGVLTGSWGAGLLGAGIGWTGTTAGFGIVSGMSIGCDPGC